MLFKAAIHVMCPVLGDPTGLVAAAEPPVATATAKNLPAAVRRAVKSTFERHGSFRVIVSEQASEILRAYGDTPKEAGDKAIAMHVKARSGGGR